MAFTMEFGTGFEMGQVPVRAGVWSASAGITSGSAHTGTYHATTSMTGTYVQVIRTAGSTSLYVGTWLKLNVAAAVGDSIQLQDVDGNVLVGLRRSGDYLHAYVGTSKVADGVIAFDNDWHLVELYALIDNATGIVQTRIDGIDDIDYSGDTQPGANADIYRVRWQRQAGAYGTWDDLCGGSGGWPGDIRFDAVLLDGDDAVAWTPSTGTDNYALLDEVPPDSDDFVYTQIDASDLYTLAAWDDTDGSGNVVKDPIAVTLWVDARKEDGGDWGEVVAFALFDAAEDGNMLYWEDLTEPTEITDGQSQEFPAGNLVVTED